MRRYRQDKRGARKSYTRKTYTRGTYDGRDGRPRIHIPIRYDGYNDTKYIVEIHRTRNTHAQRYIGVTNVMREIFKDIDGRTGRVYRGTAPYHKYIPQATTYTRPEPEPDTIISDTRTAKCIIYNRRDEIIYVGYMRRTRTLNMNTHEAHTTLLRGDRQMEAMAYIPTAAHIHGVPVRDILHKYNIEIYRIR